MLPTSDTLPVTATDDATFASLLRGWRGHRHLSQLELSLLAEGSTRHLSFLETGRSQPSRAMVLTLAEHLRVPLRERNQLLAGGAAPELLGPPANVYRLSLHPDGLARRIANLPDFAAHLLRQLRHDVEVSADPDLAALLREVEDYPDVRGLGPTPVPPLGDVVVPMRLRHPTGELALFTTITTFGTPVDVTVSELALELFFPADPATADRLRTLATVDDPPQEQ